MTRALMRLAGLLVLACSGRVSFDTHALTGSGGDSAADSGGLGAMSAGGAAGGARTPSDCGGSQPLPHPTAAGAGQPEVAELECAEGSGCYPCEAHLDCAYRWLCDPVLRVCVECLTDENCPLGTCDVGLRRCR